MPEQLGFPFYSNVYEDFRRVYSARYNRLVDEIFPQPAEDRSQQ